MLETPPSPRIRFFPGDRAIRPPGGSFRRPPLAEFGVGARSFADDTMGCRVGRAWRGRAAAGRPAAHRRAGASRGILKETYGSFDDIKNDITTINELINKDARNSFSIIGCF